MRPQPPTAEEPAAYAVRRKPVSGRISRADGRRQNDIPRSLPVSGLILPRLNTHRATPVDRCLRQPDLVVAVVLALRHADRGGRSSSRRADRTTYEAIPAPVTPELAPSIHRSL
jgi:hypothetical protein